MGLSSLFPEGLLPVVEGRVFFRVLLLELHEEIFLGTVEMGWRLDLDMDVHIARLLGAEVFDAAPLEL